MEECPRCGGTLERLSLDGISTVSCPDCAFADVPVDHESRLEGDRESWRDALNRFYEQ